MNIDAPLGLEEDLCWFYTEVGRLEEVPCAEPDPRLLCFKSARIELRIHLVERPRIDPLARRVTITVESLSDIADCLAERKVPYERLSGLTFTDRRLETHDPAGNRIEFKQGWPQAPL